MAKLFVSYSRRDSVAARKLIDAFRSIEQDVWVDWESIPPAVDWLEQIFRGIETADAFLFLISPDSIASEVCKVEINKAAENNKRIIPIVLREVHPNTTPESIRKLNWTFMRETDNFEEGLAKVKTAIELDLDWLEEHRRLQVRALEWHRKKDTSLLLRGRDLRNARHMVETATSKDPTPTDLQKAYIQHSARNERNRRVAVIASAVALVIMAALSLVAWNQRQVAINNERQAIANAQLARENETLAKQNEALANQQRGIAEDNAELALKNAREAEQARDEARAAENQAEAQGSAARAEIARAIPGQLNMSTLLAIDSWLRQPSDQAEEIMRKNISLLPVPIFQDAQLGTIRNIEFSSDGSKFLTASADGTVCLWRAEDGQQMFCAASAKPINDATFTPDGESIITGDQSGLVQVLDAQNGTVKKEFPYNEAIVDVSVRRDGLLMTAARENGKISVINLNLLRESYAVQTLGRPLVAALSPNGSWLAAGTNTGAVTYWNLGGGTTKKGPYHEDGVLALAFSPDNKYLATGGKDNKVTLTIVNTGQVALQIQHENAVRDIAFSPDNLWFVTASDDRRVRVWSTDSGRERLRILQDGIVTRVRVSPDGQWIATTGLDKTVRIWNAATGAEMLQMPLKADGSALAFDTPGTAIVAGDQSGGIHMWDISSMITSLKAIQFSGTAASVQISPTGSWLAVSDDTRVWLLRPTPLSNLKPYPEGLPTLILKSPVRQVTFSPDSQFLAALTENSEVLVYHIESQNRRFVNATGVIQSLAFSPDSQQLITGASDGTVHAWDAKSGQLESTLPGESASVLALAAAPGLVGIDVPEGFLLLDWESGEVLGGVESSAGYRLMTFSPDGSMLAGANPSGQTTIWKAQSESFSGPLTLDKDPAVSLGFNQDGSLLAVGTTNSVYLIETASGEEIARIPHGDTVTSVSFSPDGTLVTAASKFIQFWNVETISHIRSDELVATACSRLVENLSPTQWSTMFVEEKYQPLCPDLPPAQ